MHLKKQDQGENKKTPKLQPMIHKHFIWSKKIYQLSFFLIIIVTYVLFPRQYWKAHLSDSMSPL